VSANVPPALTVSSNGIGVVPDALLNTFVQGTVFVADLRQFPGIGSMNVWLCGTAAANDGGQGMFVWDGSATTADDDGLTTIAPYGLLAGRWLRQSGGPYAIATVSNIAALRQLASGAQTVWVQGYYTPGDGGEGMFILGSNQTDNGGTVIQSANGVYSRETGGQPYSWRWFGAQGIGTDDTAAILACNLAAADGPQEAFAPAGNYGLSATMPIGNGTASAASTIPGIVIRGEGQPSFPGLFTGLDITAPTTIKWLGGAVPMVAVNGPLQGWGLQNILLDGQSTASIGLNIISGQFGDCRNLAIMNCISEQIGSTTVALFSGVVNTDSLHNKYQNIFLMVPPIDGSKGVVLTGNTASNSDTDLNVFDNLLIGLPATGAAYGIYLQNADTNQFRNVLLAGGSAACIGVLLDYTASVDNFFPTANSFWGIDTNGNVLGANQWANNGTPNSVAPPNYIVGLNGANGATSPSLPNLTPPLPTNFSPNVFLESQTGSISGTGIVIPLITGTYRVSVYLGLTATGNNVTVTASVGWADPATRTFSTLPVNFSTGANNPQQYTFPVTATPDASISYSTTVTGDPGAGEYQLAIIVEKLT